jgi:hypothetical protein
MNWIKDRTAEAELNFCWRGSYGRGAGSVPGRMADCKPGVHAACAGRQCAHMCACTTHVRRFEGPTCVYRLHTSGVAV